MSETVYTQDGHEMGMRDEEEADISTHHEVVRIARKAYTALTTPQALLNISDAQRFELAVIGDVTRATHRYRLALSRLAPMIRERVCDPELEKEIESILRKTGGA